MLLQSYLCISGAFVVHDTASSVELPMHLATFLDCFRRLCTNQDTPGAASHRVLLPCAEDVT